MGQAAAGSIIFNQNWRLPGVAITKTITYTSAKTEVGNGSQRHS